MGYQRNNSDKKRLKIAYIVIGLLSFWIFLSTIAGRSPFGTLAAIPAFFMGEPAEKMVKSSEMELVVAEKDSIINALKTPKKIPGTSSLVGALGMVNIESDKLNMRSGPSLSNKIILKIPDSSEVDILEYDDEVFYLEGKQGKWCKIRFIDVEGWAWGNYIEPKQ